MGLKTRHRGSKCHFAAVLTKMDWTVDGIDSFTNVHDRGGGLHSYTTFLHICDNVPIMGLV